MKSQTLLAWTASLLVGGPWAWAQFTPGPGGTMSFGSARFEAMLARLFGTNTAFSATVEVETKDPKSSETVLLPGKFSFLDGKSRFVMDVSQAKGARMPPGAAAQLKALGMAELVIVSRPDTKLSLFIYPGLRGYVEQPTPNGESAPLPDQIKLESTALGRETLDGHPCIKNKTVLSLAAGNRYEVTVWNASDLRLFPLKVDLAGAKNPITLTFRDVEFAKPPAASFEPPEGFTRYESPQALLQQGMLKMLGGGK